MEICATSTISTVCALTRHRGMTCLIVPQHIEPEISKHAISTHYAWASTHINVLRMSLQVLHYFLLSKIHLRHLLNSLSLRREGAI